MDPRTGTIPSSVELRYTLTPEDLAHASQAMAPRWSGWLFGFMLLLLFMVGVFLIDRDFVRFGVVWIVLSGLMPFAICQTHSSQAKRAFRKAPRLRDEIFLVADEDGIILTYSTDRSELKWATYTKCDETSLLFLLHSSLYQYTIVPKRAMQHGEMIEFRRLVLAHVGN